MQMLNARLHKAQASHLQFTDSHLSEQLIRLVNAHADAIGVPMPMATLNCNSINYGNQCVCANQCRVVRTMQV